ncbi:MAG TPA: aspartate/glutamate racemase family protein [Candidatus Limnocylindrales bacterium]|nr:aspartate/glutamate racemase family protein [Candidatus Limnocylindrales bacterium]
MTDARRLALVHTVAALVPRFRELGRELMPDVETFDIVDETLLRDATADGRVSLETARRLFAHLAAAERHGADAILVTCSSMGGTVDAARRFAGVPLLRVDQAMAEQAVQRGRRIGVLATLRSTLEPTGELIRLVAAESAREVEVRERVCEGAFEALRDGDTDRHDELVRDGLRELLAWADVIVLAQASMARVIDTLSADERETPILTSPRLGMERMRDLLRGR